jgi:glutathione S-transferase
MRQRKGSRSILQPTGFPNPTPEFRAASPFAKMPALVDGDYHLADSSAIIHYLEAKYPEPRAHPVRSA